MVVLLGACFLTSIDATTYPDCRHGPAPVQRKMRTLSTLSSQTKYLKMFNSIPLLALWTLTAPLVVVIVDWVMTKRQSSSLASARLPFVYAKEVI